MTERGGVSGSVAWPHLGLPSEGRHIADLLGAQRVDDGALAHIGVPNESHADLLLI